MTSEALVLAAAFTAKEAEAIKTVLGAGRAGSTKRAYESDLRRLTRWAGLDAVDLFPIETPVVLKHLVWLIEQGYKLATIERALVAISVAQSLAAPQASPLMSAAELREFMKGLRRQRRSEVARHAPAMLLKHLEECAARIDTTSRRGIRDKALLLVGWFGALRRSEIVELQTSDVVEAPEGLHVTIRWSKTDQEGVGSVIGLPRRKDELCPAAALRAWRRVRATLPVEHNGLFVALDASNRFGQLAPQGVARILAARAPGWTPHSLRAGFATQAARAGKTVFAIKRQTRHKSTTVLEKYMREATLFDDNAANGL